jgi:hypothetical protein
MATADRDKYRKATRDDAIRDLEESLDYFSVSGRAASELAEDYVDGNFGPEDFEAGEVEFDDERAAEELAASYYEGLRDDAADQAYRMWKDG